MVSPDPALTEFPRLRPGQPFPPNQYAEFRRRPGLVRSMLTPEVPVWLVTRHEDVRAVLTDRRISSDPTNEGFPRTSRTVGVPRSDQIPGWFVGLDPPEHDRFRKTLIPEFTVRRVKQLRPAIQEVVDDRIRAMLSGGNSADLVADFALPVPSIVISTMLGVPRVDREFFEEKTRVLITLTSTDRDRDEATGQLMRYLNRLISIKEKRPADDLISKLLAAGTMSRQEVAGVSMLLLIAGHETTANSIAMGVVTLLENPEWIGDDRSVEELLRFSSITDLVALRVAIDDVEIGGQLIKAGEGVIPLIAAANYDPAAFDHPSEFDPSRSAHQHVAFGFGVHQCLGQNLVRAELEIALWSLFDRIPTLKIAEPVEDLPFKYDGFLVGLHSLPVHW